METKRKKNWWFLAINGLIAILFGILLIFFSEAMIKTLTIYFGVAVLIGGLILLLSAIRNIKQNKNAGMLLFESITSIAIGMIMILFPKDSLSFFLILVGVWAIIVGVVQLVILVNIKETFANKNLLLINGLLTIGMGVLLFFDPFTMATFLVKIVGVLSVVFGILMVYLAFAIKALNQAVEE